MSAPTQHEFWNSPAARVWSTQYDAIDRQFAPLAEALIDAAAPQSGERVLDIGCGSGTTVMALANAVGPDGKVLGLDIAETSVAAAQQRIAESGLRQADVRLGDAGAVDLPAGGFDLLFSRFGVMFFDDPVPAFAHLRSALAPTGRLVCMAWRSPAENLWATEPFAVVREFLPPQPRPGPEDPGQFAFADPARVRRILEGAGFRDIALTPCDRPMLLGATAEAATEGALRLGPTARALLGADDALRAHVRDILLGWFKARATSDGIVLPGATWLIRAT